MWFWSAAELYELLVVRRRWSPDQMGHLATEAMIAAHLCHRWRLSVETGWSPSVLSSRSRLGPNRARATGAGLANARVHSR